MTTQLETVHPFSHIAQPPYRFIGFSTPEGREAQQESLKAEGKLYTTNLCGGTCDHCGSSIELVCTLEGMLNGSPFRFKVGSTCVEKAANSPKIVDKVKKLVSDRRTKLKNEKIDAVYTKAIETMNDRKEYFQLQPHPKGFEGQTLYDYLYWFSCNAGKAKFNQTIAKYL